MNKTMISTSAQVGAPYTPSESTLHVLEVFAHSADVAIDRIAASRSLLEAAQAIPGNDPGAWSRQLAEVGESLNLRVRQVECTFSEALAFVQQGIPVAYVEDTGDQGLRWTVIAEMKGRRVRRAAIHSDQSDQWSSISRLKRDLGVSSLSDRKVVTIGQPALPCQRTGRSAQHRSHDGETLSPLARLIGLIRTEKRDLWVVLIFSLIVGVLALATPIAVEALVNTVAFGRYVQPVVILALLLFTFLAFAAGLRALITYAVEIIQRRLFIRVVEDLAYRLPQVNVEEFDDKDGPELMNRFFDVVTVQKTASALLLDGISIVLQTAIGMAVLAFYHPFLLGFDVLLLASIAFVIFALGHGSVKTAIIESKKKYAIASWLEELARHKTAFRVHAGSRLALERADQLAVDWLDTRRSHFRVLMRQILFALGLQAVAATVLLGLGGWLVIIGELNLGQLVAAELIVMMIVGSFAKIGKHMESFYDLLASVDKLGSLFDLTIGAQDGLFYLGRVGPAEVKIDSVGYKYKNHAVLSNVSHVFSPGESIAITGKAGSGKSTLADILCGLRMPSSGHVNLDGYDLRELRSDSLREHLALARSNEIFNGTIDENVHMNRSHLQADDVRDSLEFVGLFDDVLKQEDGLNTVLQTNGAPLTGSQAKRLMLARAIVGRPRLLVIDSTLDGLPEADADEIMQKLTAPGSPWTLLIITSRKDIMTACDRTVQI